VARAFESFGYYGERDQRIEGQQVDLVATKDLPEAGEVRRLIQCRYKATGSIGCHA
jgi:hypothetical protein